MPNDKAFEKRSASDLGINEGVGLALIPLYFARPIFIVVGLVQIRVLSLLVQKMILKRHHFQIVLQSSQLLPVNEYGIT